MYRYVQGQRSRIKVTLTDHNAVYVLVQDPVGMPEALKGRFQDLVAMKNSRRN